MSKDKQAEFGRRMLSLTKECIVEGAWQCDVEMMADAAVLCGLMEHVSYDPKKHSGIDEGCEPGDMVYYWGET